MIMGGEKYPKSEINAFSICHSNSTVTFINKVSGPSVCPSQVEKQGIFHHFQGENVLLNIHELLVNIP